VREISTTGKIIDDADVRITAILNQVFAQAESIPFDYFSLNRTFSRWEKRRGG
jgi:hypothetical protein